MKISTDVKANRLYSPQLIGLITTIYPNGKPNVATFAWITSVSSNPEMIAVCLAPKRYTYECIAHNKEFVINLPTVDIIDKVWFCGKHSGRDVDKFKETGLTPLDSIRVKPPRIKECATHLECKLANTFEIGDHIVVIGEVIAKSCEDGMMVGGSLDVAKVKPLLHAGGSKFVVASEVVDVK